MTGHDLRWRLCGVALFVMGCATGLLLGASHPAQANEAADGAATAIGLAGFAMACFGVALMVQGAVFRDRWRRERHRQMRLHDKRVRRRARYRSDDRGLAATAFDTGRDGVANMLAERALRRERR